VTRVDDSYKFDHALAELSRAKEWRVPRDWWAGALREARRRDDRVAVRALEAGRAGDGHEARLIIRAGRCEPREQSRDSEPSGSNDARAGEQNGGLMSTNASSLPATIELFRAPAGKTWHVAKVAGFPVALDGFTTPPNVDAVVESGIDARAEKHAGKSICRTCRAAVARDLAAAAAESSDEPVDAPVESSDDAKVAKTTAAKSNGSKSADAKPVKMTKTELKDALARMAVLQPKWAKYHEARKSGKPADKRPNVAAYREYEGLYSKIRKSGRTLAEARKEVA